MVTYMVLWFMPVRVVEYIDRNGHSAYADWFGALNAQAAAKVATASTRMSLGNFSNVKGVGGGTYEYVIDFGPGYRIYFGKDGEQLVILLGGGSKKQQQKDIRKAIGLWEEYKHRKKWGNRTMALTRDFKGTIKARAERDPVFRRELLIEGIEAFIAGDVETGKAVLRDYINATVGFAKLAEKTDIPTKSLMRMLSPSGNPQAQNLFGIVAYLQKKEHLQFKVKAAYAGQRVSGTYPSL